MQHRRIIISEKKIKIINNSYVAEKIKACPLQTNTAINLHTINIFPFFFNHETLMNTTNTLSGTIKSATSD